MTEDAIISLEIDCHWGEKGRWEMVCMALSFAIGIISVNKQNRQSVAKGKEMMHTTAHAGASLPKCAIRMLIICMKLLLCSQGNGKWL